nr:hypothetical protein [Kofleriaceae bacterium]
MTTHALQPAQPFSFARTLAFARSFPACRGDYQLTDDSLTLALPSRGRAVPVTITATTVTTGDPALVPRAIAFVGARDDLSPLYRAAADDPPFRRVVDALHGLHHLRFPTLGEIAVYAVMMQRTPIAMAATYKRRFLDRFGLRVAHAGGELRAMPELDQLVQLDAADIAGAIGHARKAAAIVDVVRGVARLGEDLLAHAPYDEARDALLAIRGIGPFSAAAILLRGLGRMTELPWLPAFDDAGRAVYGSAFDRREIERRYGDHIGYWSFYARVGSSIRA